MIKKLQYKFFYLNKIEFHFFVMVRPWHVSSSNDQPFDVIYSYTSTFITARLQDGVSRRK